MLINKMKYFCQNKLFKLQISMKKIIRFKVLILCLLVFHELMFGIQVFGQKTTITGKVTESSTNNPLPGVTVLEKGTSNGTTTNTEGNFSITVNNESVLIFSFIGFSSQEISVKGKTKIDMSLSQKLLDLEEVIVTGYGTQKKADLTGAVSVVKMSDVTSNSTANIMATLPGRLPGVTISIDGTPGGGNASALIRGVTTINSSGPLYVIDGIQTRSDISTLLNSNDVESIQVLKDAASASIYGVQAANGVIIITTKKAVKNQTRVDFDVLFTTERFHTGIKMLNTEQWGETYWTAYKNDGVKPNHVLYGNGNVPVIPEFIDAPKNTIQSGNTNWANEIYKPSFLQNYNLTLSKGSENGSSTLSFNYYDEDGLVKYTNFTRFNIRYGSSYSFLKNRFRVGESLNLSSWTSIGQPGGIEELVIAQHPIIPVYDIYGGYAGPTSGIGDKPNPVRLVDQQKTNRSNYFRTFGNIYTEIEPFKNFVLRSSIGINYQNSMNSNFEPKWKEGDRVVDLNALNSSASLSRDWVFSNTLTYDIKFKNHSINALIGTEAKQYMSESLSGRREDYLIESLDYRYLSTGNGSQTNSGSGSLNTYVSYFGKVNYSFLDRYLLSGTIRRDLSSRFGKNNRGGTFPAMSVGWRISKEGFMKNINSISDLKLRASWGQNGNDQISSNATYTIYGTNLTNGGYDINGSNQGVISTGIIRNSTGNADVKWEITTQTNLGIDMTLFKDHLSMTVDYFIKNTEGMLISVPYAAVIGEGGNMSSNGASMQNKGLEGLLTWRDNLDLGLHYEVTLTGSHYSNLITYLPQAIYYTWGGGDGISNSIVGQPYGSWFGYVTNGLYRTQNDIESDIKQVGYGLGRIRYEDLNHDKIINTWDRTWLGSNNPKFEGGLNVAINYKSFDMSFYLRGMKRDAYNNSRFYTDFFQLWTGNHSVRLLDAWNSTDHINSNIPALTALNSNTEDRTSTYFIEDGSFVKMKSLIIGYTLPKEMLTRVNIRSMRVFIQGEDLFTITKYTGADPEGLGYSFPLPRKYTFGINVGF
jgi:TonB-linked SusC/RagA family outer membrane protein